MKKFLFLLLFFSQLFSCFAGEPRRRGGGERAQHAPSIAAAAAVASSEWNNAASTTETSITSKETPSELCLIKKGTATDKVLLEEIIDYQQSLIPCFTAQYEKTTVIGYPTTIQIIYKAETGQTKNALIRPNNFQDITTNVGYLALLHDTALSFYALNKNLEKTEFEVTNGSLTALCKDAHDKGFIAALHNPRQKEVLLQKITDKLELGTKHPFGNISIIRLQQILLDQIAIMYEDKTIKIVNNNFEPLIESSLIHYENVLPLYFLAKNKDATTIAEKNEINEQLLNDLKKICLEGPAGAIFTAAGTTTFKFIKGAIGFKQQEPTKEEDLHEKIREKLNADGIPNNLNDLFVGTFEEGDYLISVLIKNSKNETVLKFIPINIATKELVEKDTLPKKEYYKLPIYYDKNGQAFVTKEKSKIKYFVGQKMDSEMLRELYKAGITQ